MWVTVFPNLLRQVDALMITTTYFSLFPAHKEKWEGGFLFGVPVLPRRPLLGVIGPLCGMDYLEAAK